MDDNFFDFTITINPGWSERKKEIILQDILKYFQMLKRSEGNIKCRGVIVGGGPCKLCW